jgi:flagellar basal body-associated protein FliL
MSEQHSHSEKKQGLSKIKLIFLILIFLGVGFVILNQMGVKIVETSERVEMTNNPRSSNQTWDEFKEKKGRRLAERKERTKVASNRLNAFVEDYRKTGNRNLKSADIKFMKKMDEKVKKESSTIETATQYYSFMKNSMKFYNTMRRFTGMTQKSTTPTKYPNSREDADRYIDRIFSIEQEKLEIFTESDPDPDEWMEFLGE